MTVLTKPSDVKKPEKAILVEPSVAAMEAGGSPPMPEGRGLVMVRSRKTSSHLTTLLLFLIALLVMSIGILGGIAIYRQYASQKFNFMRFHGGCRIPYNTEIINNDEMMAANREFLPEDDQLPWIKQLISDLNQFAEQMISETKDFGPNFDNSPDVSKAFNTTDASKFLQEDVELDVSDDESYSKIMPKFLSGNSATFLHDFKFEQSGIIDKAAGTCFVMPLDKETLVAPKTLADLISKMRNGYYNINTDILQKNMRVKLPAISDMSSISPRIANECSNLKLYELEKVVSGVFKRSIDSPVLPSYIEFNGNGFNAYHVVNADQINADVPEDI